MFLATLRVPRRVVFRRDNGRKLFANTRYARDTPAALSAGRKKKPRPDVWNTIFFVFYRLELIKQKEEKYSNDISMRTNRLQQNYILYRY